MIGLNQRDTHFPAEGGLHSPHEERLHLFESAGAGVGRSVI